MTNLLYIVSSAKKCGPMNVLYNIVKHLDNNKFNIHLLELSSSNDEVFKQSLVNIGVKVHSLNNSRIKGIFSNKKQVYEYIHKNNINIVHCHGLRADSVIASLKAKLPCKCITTIHNRIIEDYSASYGETLGKIIARKHVQAIKKLDIVVSCSQSVRSYIKEKYNIKSVCVLNGIDNEYFNSIGKRKELRRELGLNEDNKIFLFCGGLIQVKNPVLAVKGFLEANVKNTLLIILGDGDLRDEINTLIGDNKNILLKGHVIDVLKYLQSSDIYLSTSESEGMPNAVLEAMSTGLPCILSDIDSHKEINNMNGDVFIFEKDNYKELAKCIKEICSEKKLITTSEKNKKLAKEIFGSNVMAEQYKEIYLER
ncbi:glycosyltransferase family 4 protein [Clostridium tarantellae]|uniref:Glycosyltransferase n=1 Tax=Clostridium tarantellae TaxID=39493 RepID=A0A6I1MMH2_9CLOT|nr:glycosyltransferase family 4 protein [Clostridium tarantellae]MPQ44204.1 glycosyltransferase [Clostridium tarantellae]